MEEKEVHLHLLFYLSIVSDFKELLIISIFIKYSNVVLKVMKKKRGENNH